MMHVTREALCTSRRCPGIAVISRPICGDTGKPLFAPSLCEGSLYAPTVLGAWVYIHMS